MSDALQKLHTTMIDTREGYVAAKSDAESEPLKALFQSMIDLRDRDHAEILLRAKCPSGKKLNRSNRL